MGNGSSKQENTSDQEHKPNTESQKQAAETLLVGAIDFGTTNSGWAFSFLHDFQRDPTKGFVKQWNSGSALITEKAPTCLLIKSDGKTLEAFGYEAENKYRELADEGKHGGYYYFRRFKMMLNKKLGEKLGREITLEDEMGKSLKALHVFSMAIEYLVENMMKTVNDRLTYPALGKNDVHWVLTVPAIWTDAAKQFMREAAVQVSSQYVEGLWSYDPDKSIGRTDGDHFRIPPAGDDNLVEMVSMKTRGVAHSPHVCIRKAGLSTDKLTVALEPEAASIFCRHLSVDTAVSGGNISIAKMSVGTRYMILDAGGGTIDITVHEVVSANGVKEIHAASGGGWGGILVDEAFENLLNDLERKQGLVYNTFKMSETDDWLDLWRDFEVKKRAITPEKKTRVHMKFPLSFSKTFESVTKTKLVDAIAASKYAEDIDFGGDKIKFSASLFKGFFKKSIKQTVSHMKTLLIDENVRKIKAILMVGGYSESPLLQEAIKNEFPGIDVVIPLGASSTILRGALVYGHCPLSIMERVLKYTYGVETTHEFEEGVDPEHLKFVTETGVRCWRFSKYVERGQIVKCNESQAEKIYTTIHTFQRCITFPVYASTQTDIKYTDDGKYIGELTLEFSEPEKSPGRRVMFSMTFSGTEIKVKAVDKKTGKGVSAYIDFLG